MKNIVVAVDFSNATTGVLEMASGLAKAFGARVLVTAGSDMSTVQVLLAEAGGPYRAQAVIDHLLGR